jgi:hypothetical protein
MIDVSKEEMISLFVSPGKEGLSHRPKGRTELPRWIMIVVSKEEMISQSVNLKWREDRSNVSPRWIMIVVSKRGMTSLFVNLEWRGGRRSVNPKWNAARNNVSRKWKEDKSSVSHKWNAGRSSLSNNAALKEEAMREDKDRVVIMVVEMVTGEDVRETKK